MSSVKHRLHALCSYFAMFPHTFVRKYLFAFTGADDVVLDPFRGRGTTLLESLLLDRKTLAVDINPVAACVAGAKARVPVLPAIASRLDELECQCRETGWLAVDEERRALPRFFAHAFHYWTLRELLFISRHKGGFIICRIGGKRQSLDALARGMVTTVRSAFPSVELVFGPFASLPVQRQTDNFRPGTGGCGVEADFVFRT